jgi:hypothetical protein
LTWAQGVLDGLVGATVDSAKRQIVSVASTQTRERFLALVAEPFDALVLVDHVPFVASAGPTAADSARGEAHRAVLAFELARRAGRTLVLSADDVAGWPSALAKLLGLPFSGGVTPPPVQAEAEAPEGLPMETYLAPLFAAAAQARRPTLVWPREAFLDGDTPGKTLPATVEIAGRARILAYGPYLPLPAGGWRARAYLGFSPDIGEMPFILEVDTGGAVSRGFFEVDRGGIFTLDLEFQVADALHPVEMHLISQESALDGLVSLIEIVLEPIAVP